MGKVTIIDFIGPEGKAEHACLDGEVEPDIDSVGFLKMESNGETFRVPHSRVTSIWTGLAEEHDNIVPLKAVPN